MGDPVLGVRLVSITLFAALAVSSLRRYRSRRDAPTRWFGITFAELTVVGAAIIVLPPEPRRPLDALLLKLTDAAFLLFPYLLFRFTGAFTTPSRRTRVAAAALTAVTAGWVLALPELPGPDDPVTGWVAALTLTAVVQWTLLTSAAAVRLWRAGRGWPTVTRRRLRTMALGSGGMGGILIVVGAAPRRGTVTELSLQLLALLCALAFTVGFSPPRILRRAWRQREEGAAWAAEAALMTASTEQEVAQASLPHLAAIIGAGAAGLYADDGRLIGSYGARESLPDLQSEPRAEDNRSGPLRPDLISLDLPSGRLVVSAGPYAPFFGQEELSLARGVGALASLALERCAGSRREREVRHQLADAQDVARLGSWEWEVATGKILWSDALYRVYGLQPGDPVATEKGILERIHPDDQDNVRRVILQACNDLQPFSFDHRIVLPDGSFRHVHGRGKVVAGPDGKPVKLLGTAQDVSERMAVADRLRASEEMFRNMLASAPDAVVAVRDDGRIALVNEQAERLFGYPSAELIGQPVEGLMAERFRPRHAEHRIDYLRSPSARPMGAGIDLTARRKDGREFPVDISLSAMETNGGRLVTAFIRDLTGRREAEENARRLRAAEVRQRQALELNDDIVQGLTVARYALELGEEEVARRAVDQTLASARAIVSDLLDSEDSGADLGPGDLVRKAPVRLGSAGDGAALARDRDVPEHRGGGVHAPEGGRR